MSSAANLGWHSIAKGGIVIPRPPVDPRDRAHRGTPRDPVALSLPPIGNRGDPGPCTPRRGDPTSFRDQQQQPQHRATPRRLLALQPKQTLRHSWPGFVRGPQGMGHRGSLLLGGRSEGRLCQPRPPAGEKGGTAEGGALPGAEGDPAAPFSLCLTPEAIGVLQKRRLAQGLRLGGVDEEGEKKRRGQAGRGRGVGHVASGELVQGFGGEIFSETEVPKGLLRISLLNDRHRYDDVEYEDDDDDRGGGGGGVKSARTLHVDAGVRDKCVMWLRGLEEARGGHSLPHLIL
ncbi:proline-rich protein 18 [Lethenteron reissneri]|uniref:proline-rich protein 18 n=1 Tax=Lethenteron reissneri TaxID=7753 RepID=UPI002AB68C61|nr:proline-rich protein 18 [Lethenteron reissneri]XP_061425109.1 proline-rich protein 18 [Lethenteron reissneri]